MMEGGVARGDVWWRRERGKDGGLAVWLAELSVWPCMVGEGRREGGS